MLDGFWFGRAWDKKRIGGEGDEFQLEHITFETMMRNAEKAVGNTYLKMKTET